MRVGVFYFPTDYGISPAELGRALEERGFIRRLPNRARALEVVKLPDSMNPSLGGRKVRFEPSVALYSGHDGLTLVKRLVGCAASRLAPDGLFVTEFGFGQDDEVIRWMREAYDRA